MAITVLDVLDTAIGIAGFDVQFRPKARLYYNLSIREQSRDFDWPFWNLLADPVNFVTGQVEYDLPENYSRGDTVYLLDSNGNRGAQCYILEQTAFDAQRMITLEPATPRYCYVDQNRRKLVFEAAPATGGYVLRYFRKGTEIDISGADDANAPDFEDETFLIKKITAWFMDYSDDDRYQAKMMETDKKLRENKLNVFDTDANSKVQLASSVHKPGRRPTRGGGCGF